MFRYYDYDIVIVYYARLYCTRVHCVLYGEPNLFIVVWLLRKLVELF